MELASVILEQLASLSSRETWLLSGVRGDFRRLGYTMSAIEAVFVDAEERRINDPSIQYWLKKLEDVLEDANDLMAEFDAETLRRSGDSSIEKVRNFFSSHNQIVFYLKMRRKIRKILQRLDQIAEERYPSAFGLGHAELEKTPVPLTRRPETDSFVRVEDIIGREEDKEKIVKWLLDDNVDIHSKEFDVHRVIPVFPIVGMGGLGKTALAQLIINDERVRDHFELKYWVHVGVNVGLRQILCKLLRQIGDSDPDNLDMDVLIHQFRERILGKRYLFVLDDLWSVDHKKWQELKYLLAAGAQKGSRVIVTTQILKFAEITGTVVPYRLGRLGEEASWSLFHRVAFRDGYEPRDSTITESVKMRIMRKCGGNPLAITTIGRILYCRNPQECDSFSKMELPNDVELVGGGIIETLGLRIVVLQNCLSLGTGARKDLGHLNSQLRAVKVLLFEAAKTTIHSELVRARLDRIEEILHEADDLLAELHGETLQGSMMAGSKINKRVSNVFSTQLVFSRKVRHKIKNIHESLAEMLVDGRMFHLLNRQEETPVPLTRLPETDSLVRVEDIIGREEDKEKIVKWLLDDYVDIHSKEFDVDVVIPVLPIVGIGGLGKTALAQLVINDERVRDHFELRSWVHVGVNVDLRQIVCKLLRQISAADPENHDTDALIHQFRERILGKRCLFVLDDLWSVNHKNWQELKDLLKYGAQEGSRIIVTTQIQKSAEITGTVVPYRLGCLGEEASWSLFQRMAFRDGREPSDSRITENVKMRIMRRSGGSPLAIMTIGRILYCRKPQEWDSFSNRELPNVVELGGGGIIETLRLRIVLLETCLSLGTGARKELQELNSQLRAFKVELLGVPKTAIHSNQFQGWLNQIEKILHDANDLLAELHGETLHGSMMAGSKIHRRVPNVFSTQFVSGRMVHHKIRKIRKSLYEILMERMRFHLEERQEETPERWGETPVPLTGRLETDSFARQEDIIGREEDKQKIVKWLLDDVDSKKDVFPVLPIVGMGGLGKTALAQLVFNDEMVRDHFELRSWIHVGDKVDVRQILSQLLRQITDSGSQNVEMEVLINQFRERILGKRYLFVLDDLWYVDGRLKDLMDLFTSAAGKGGRVIVTTRIQSFAEITVTAQPHYLDHLGKEASWSLFQRMAFRDRREAADSGITENAKMIIERKCCGNPLAIRTIGRMLYYKKPQEWESFLLENEVSSGVQYDWDGGITETLKLSYNELPSHLRKCFAFCRLFPQGYEIDVRMLVSLWISQGFIRSSNCGSDGNDLEHIGYLCFTELLQRSFFEEPKTDESGNITRCKMQNLMHDLAISITKTRYVTYGSTSEENKCSKKTHHVSFGFHLDSPWQIPTDLVQVKAIRSIILTRQSQWEIKGVSGDSICNVIASKFKLLRMLDLHNSGIKVVPDSIGELKLLKYLDLSQNKDIEALPRSFCRLLNLHTLKLNGCGRLQELPRKTRKLFKLRRLEIDSCYSLTQMPRGLGQLTNLHTLSEFVLSRGNGSASRHAGELDELAKLNELKGQLRIKNLRPGRNVSTEVLKQKTHLRSVMLIWDTSASFDNDARIKAAEDSLDGLKPHSSLEEMSISAYGGIRFSEWLSSHANLVKLSLSKCMNCKHLPLLNRLTKLKVLVVDEMASLEYVSDYIVNPPTAVYPSLKELRLTNCPKLDRWWEDETGVEETTFCCLSKLIIEDCPRLNSMPLFPHLEELLLLKNTSWEPFRHTIRRQQIPSQTTAAEASSSTSSTNPNLDHPLSKLMTLRIIQMPDGDTDMWQYLQSLNSLMLDHLSNIETLLQRLRPVNSLKELHILRCDSLSQITPWIRDLQSLRKLSIRLCPSLTIPFDQIVLLSSLRNVEIEDCPKIVHLENLLKERNLRR